MKYFFVVIFAACISCNQPAGKKDDTTTAAATTEKTAPPEDALTLKLRTAITAIEKTELEQINPLKAMTIDSIQHQMISLKDFYNLKKEDLNKSMKLSTNKEKTAKAIDYLEKMVAQSSVEQNVYAIKFHMTALLANNVFYNEQHTKYLKDDMSEIRVIFP